MFELRDVSSTINHAEGVIRRSYEGGERSKAKGEKQRRKGDCFAPWRKNRSQFPRLVGCQEPVRLRLMYPTTSKVARKVATMEAFTFLGGSEAAPAEGTPGGS